MNYKVPNLSKYWSDPAPEKSGSNQIGVRHYNERLILDIIARHGEISKADIARLTKLSPQTVTVIVNQMMEEELLTKKAAVKGKVGQPSTPIALNPDGAVSIGIKLGRRSIDVLGMSFTNEVIYQYSMDYDYPDPDKVLGWVKDSVESLKSRLTKKQRSRLLGIGLAAPFHLEGWEGVLKAPSGMMKKWQGFDMRQEIEQATGIQTFLLNDASAACLAELQLHMMTQSQSFLYYYIGTFLGGGLVLDGQLYTGLTGNAASLGSMPQGIAANTRTPIEQMVDAASFHKLEKMAIEAGFDRRIFLMCDVLSPEQEAVFSKWADEASRALAFSILASQSILDIKLIILDGLLSKACLKHLIDKLEKSFALYLLDGLHLPEIKAGHLGNHARAIGGAILPFHAHFGMDNTIVMKG